MRSAWKVRLAGLPPVRLAACGSASRISSTSRALLRERLLGALPYDRLDDALGLLLLAVRAQDPHQFARRVGVEHLGGADARRLVHAHVERGVLRVREAAVGLVQLHGGDAEVEEDALDARDAEPVEHVGQLVVDGVHQRGPVAVRGEPLPGEPQRLLVAVERDSRAAGKRGEQGLAVAAEAEGAVDDDGAGLGQRGGQQVQAALEHHRDVSACWLMRAPRRRLLACRLLVGRHAPFAAHVLLGPRPLEGEVACRRRGRGVGRPGAGGGRAARTRRARGEFGPESRGASRLPLRATLVHSSLRSTNRPRVARRRRGRARSRSLTRTACLARTLWVTSQQALIDVLCPPLTQADATA